MEKRIVEKIKSACPPGQLGYLERLLASNPFRISDLGYFKGNPTLGMLVVDAPVDGFAPGLWLSPKLLNGNDKSALAVFLHELVHAGAFTGGHVRLHHDKTFFAAQAPIMKQFEIELSEEFADYCLSETTERLEEQQPSGLAVFTVMALLAMAFAGFGFYNFSVEQVGLFIGLAAATVFFERARRRAAQRREK